MKADSLELQILRELRKDGRISYRKLGKKLGIATGTVQNKVEKMLKEGVIKRIRASINYEKLGYKVTAIIGISIPNRKDLPKIEGRLQKYKNVFNVYEVTGAYDLMITTRFKTMDDFAHFLIKDLAVEGIGNSTTFMVIGTKKEEFTLL